MKTVLHIAFLSLLSLSAVGQNVPKVQSAIITKVTATWCRTCGEKAWDDFEALIELHEDKAVLIAAHSSPTSNLHTKIAGDLVANLPSVFGQPLFYVNAERLDRANVRVEAEEQLALATEVPVIANAGIEASWGDNQLEVQTRYVFFSDTEGEYFLSVLVLENGVISNQASRGAAVPHHKVLRAAANDDVFGTAIAEGAIREGTEGKLSFQIPAAEDWFRGQIELVAVIWKREDGQYHLVNANTGKAQILTSNANATDQGITLEVSSDPGARSGTAWLDLTRPVPDLSLSLWDLSGRPVHTLFRGNLSTGRHSFRWNANALGAAAGMYLLRLNHGRENVVRKIILYR